MPPGGPPAGSFRREAVSEPGCRVSLGCPGCAGAHRRPYGAFAGLFPVEQGWVAAGPPSARNGPEGIASRSPAPAAPLALRPRDSPCDPANAKQ